MKQPIENIQTINLEAFIQRLAARYPRCVLHLRNRRRHRGTLGLDGGSLTWAQTGRHEGTAALSLIFSWELPCVTTLDHTTPPAQNITPDESGDPERTLRAVLQRARLEGLDLRVARSMAQTRPIRTADLGELIQKTCAPQNEPATTLAEEDTIPIELLPEPVRARLLLLDELASELHIAAPRRPTRAVTHTPVTPPCLQLDALLDPCGDEDADMELNMFSLCGGAFCDDPSSR